MFTVPSVLLLALYGDKTTIIRRIIAIYVNSIQRELAKRRINVISIIECPFLKIAKIFPFFAYRYAAPTIIAIRTVFWVFASSAHALPDMVKTLFAGFSALLCSATTISYFARQKSVGTYKAHIAAIASA